MTDTLVDTNIIIDLSGPDPLGCERSAQALAAAGDEGPLIVNQVIYAELAARYQTREELDDTPRRADFKCESLPWDAAYMAGIAFLSYRRGVVPGRCCSPTSLSARMLRFGDTAC